MTNQLRNKSFLFILGLLLFNSMTFAQQLKDSLSIIKHQADKNYNDSVTAAHQLIYEAQKHYQDSIEVCKKAQKLEAFFKQNPDSVFTVNLSNTGLKDFPPIHQYTKVKLLQLYNNHLSRVHKKDWPLSDSMETIVLEGNKLKKVRFKKNMYVKSLNLSDNILRKIPYSIRHLKNLRHLDLTKNKIKRIPRFIKRMDNLVELKLNYNQLGSLNKRTIKRLKNLKSIHIGANGISSIPESIDDLKNLETLNLGMNHISSVPASFAKLVQLEHLIFYKNNFDSIPPEIWELANLKEIDFYHNKIREIPHGISKLKKLEQLYLAYNHIDKIPEILISLDQLKAIYLHHNQIIMIPVKIVDLDSLQYLDLGYNRIFEVPDMSGMKELLEIDLQENSLSEFPYELLENESLVSIYLMGNPFVMTKEEQAEMEHLRIELKDLGIRFFF